MQVAIAFITSSFRYHGDWRSETQTAVSQLAFIHWLETGELLLHTEAEEKLGCMFFVLVFFLFTFDLNRNLKNLIGCGVSLLKLFYD